MLYLLGDVRLANFCDDGIECIVRQRLNFLIGAVLNRMLNKNRLWCKPKRVGLCFGRVDKFG